MNNKVLVLIATLTLALACKAEAQTPTPLPDVPLLPTGGIYLMLCHSPTDADLAQICFVRTDMTAPIELGCVAALPDTDVSSELNVSATIDDDAELRCYATDTSGLVSDYSLNAGIVDFTKPGRPFVR